MQKCNNSQKWQESFEFKKVKYFNSSVVKSPILRFIKVTNPKS